MLPWNLLLATSLLLGGMSTNVSKALITLAQAEPQIQPKFSQANAVRKLRGTVGTTLIAYQQPTSFVGISAGVENALDTATTIYCPTNTQAPCAIEADLAVEAHVNSATQGEVCFKVDGVTVLCPSADMATNAGVLSMTNIAYPVTPGSHTVQGFVKPYNQNGFRRQFTIKYIVYKTG